ncbi:MAG: hypothetical protein AAGJ85_06910, partial [Pseudomonadota bacterium]
GPADLAGTALERAFRDAGIGPQNVDLCLAVRLFGDSGPAFPNPFGGPDNLGAAALARLGASAQKHIYSHAGGEQPQTFVAEAAKALIDGEAQMVAILGAEAIANVKAAGRAGASPDWFEATGVPMEDRGPFAPGPFMVSPQAIAHRIAAPVYYYALMETARRAALGESRAAYAQTMGALWEHFAAVAADNPHAAIRTAPSGADIVTPGSKNPIVTTPYTKAMVARDGVNLGAAILMTTYGHAKALGVKDVTFLHAHTHASEPAPITRATFHRAPAQAVVLKTLQDKADMIDLYSCFPIVPLEAMAELGLNIGDKPITLTGGLPFFGGPGNNYSLHAIAEAHARVRGTAKTAGIYANGGLSSKHAAGLYGGEPPDALSLRKSDDTPESVTLTTEPNPEGRILTYTVEHRRGEPTGVLVVGETKDGARFYARGGAERAPEFLEGDPIGETITTVTKAGVNGF